MKSYDIDTLYQKYKSLNKRQRVRLLSRLQAQGIAIVRIQPYAYSEAPGIKHLFFYFEGSRSCALFPVGIFCVAGGAEGVDGGVIIIKWSI